MLAPMVSRGRGGLNSHGAPGSIASMQAMATVSRSEEHAASGPSCGGNPAYSPQDLR